MVRNSNIPLRLAPEVYVGWWIWNTRTKRKMRRCRATLLCTDSNCHGRDVRLITCGKTDSHPHNMVVFDWFCKILTACLQTAGFQTNTAVFAMSWRSCRWKCSSKRGWAAPKSVESTMMMSNLSCAHRLLIYLKYSPIRNNIKTQMLFVKFCKINFLRSKHVQSHSLHSSWRPSLCAFFFFWSLLTNQWQFVICSGETFSVCARRCQPIRRHLQIPSEHDDHQMQLPTCRSISLLLLSLPLMFVFWSLLKFWEGGRAWYHPI